MDIAQQKFLEQIGKNIKEIREQQGLSIAQLADKTGLRKEYIKKIEAGNAVRLKTGQLFIISDALNISIKILFKDTL